MMEDWQHRRPNINYRRCANVRIVWWIGTELRNTPVYDGISDVNVFLSTFEETIEEERRILDLDMVLRTLLARWWAMHKDNLHTWDEVQTVVMKHRFFPS